MSIPIGERPCSKCNITQDNSEFRFYVNRISPLGFRLATNRVCNTCNKKYSKEMASIRKTAPTRPMLPYQCDNCSKNIITSRTLQLDHDHKTNKFRGWLCKECNVSIGNVGDSVFGMLRASLYLNKSENAFTKEELEVICNIMERLK